LLIFSEARPYSYFALHQLRVAGILCGARGDAAKHYADEFGKPAPEGFCNIRVHDLKHTFGRRLRRAGVSFEDRQDLLGHKSSRVTTDYSAPEIEALIDAAERAAVENPHKSPTLGLVAARGA
jgi:integrase